VDDDLKLNSALVGKIPEDDAIYFEKKPDPKTKKLVRGKPYLLKRDVALTGDRLQTANAVTDKFNNWEVEIKFDADGADKFAQITGENVHNRMAVILENVIETAPVIQDKIEGGSAVITLGGGNRNPQQQSQEAANIARVLRTGALPAPVRIEQNKTVGPSLGQDSIVKGIRASVLGVGLVFLFAWYWYRWSGFIATVALAVNAVIMLALMTLFDATLTLPGIAGIVLTTGMAVDANVLIYERIREEMRLGKTVRSAIEAGFERAFWTVVDSHMTTAVAGAVLYVYGTDQIKGFAVTLLLGIATSLFTALVISRLCFDYWTIKLKPEVLSI
jgi:preprotein translocase subunit SecD